MAAPLPEGVTGHSGTLYKGVPTICGGAVTGSMPTQTCYHYTEDTESGQMIWTNNVNILFCTYHLGS